VMIAYQSLKLERRRSEAQRELRDSHDRYRTLVESAASGTLLIVEGRCTYANTTFLDTVGYSAAQLAFLDARDLFIPDDHSHSFESLECIASGEEVREPFEAGLRRKNGETIPVLLSSTPAFYSGRQGLIVTIQELTRQRAMQSDTERDRLISQLQSSLLFLTEPVHSAMSKPVCCGLDTSIAEAVRLMGRSDTDAVTVTGPSGEVLGIITNHDIRERVVVAGVDTRVAVSRIMSAPVVSINENAPVFDALLLERERTVDHLVVTDAADRLVGIIRSSRAVRPEQYSPIVVTRQAHTAGSVHELADIYRRLPALVGSLLDSGAVSRNVCHIITTVSDAITRRVITLAFDELGKAPVPFAFLALGSEARQEQTLVTDQDNAIVYRGPSPVDATSDVSGYFLGLGGWICDALNEIGYEYCKSDVMAKNSRWNQPLSQWKHYFSTWIDASDESALAHCTVFFDHRTVYGDTGLADELWNHVNDSISCRPAFLSYLALNTLNDKPPVGVFGKIVTESSGANRNNFSIKEAMMPVVNYARLLAIRHGIENTNTFDRLDRASQLEALTKDSHRGITEAYGQLMQLRFRHQIELLRAGEEPDNFVDPGALTDIEAGAVRQAFSRISAIRKKVGYEFRGTG
jgi:PAS domain S-box-containing protein